ncbi:MAG TPA: SusD/RagB family nutrient-binding outer membrane lipoprotein [Gemmatimonadales bacterium]|nr:SusD/RagB family nutrient-binding outer membrane lipoprotein [Gemmatimonadales bacterium]
MRYTILSVLAAATLAGGTSCSDLTSINQNPNGPTAVPPPSLLSNVIQATVNGVDGVNSLNIRAAGLWVQYYAEIQYRDEDKYLIRAGTDGGWGFYSGAVEDAQRMINGGVAAGAPNWEAVGRIMKSYLYSVMTDAMGGIPYSEALKGDSLLTPKYDTQQAIYTALFADLTKASQQIDLSGIPPAGVGFPKGDIMYGGDLTKWRKFANSLRLRLAMHLASVDPATAQSEALSALAAGVFQSNADNAQLLYLAGAPNQNPIYDDALGRDDYGMSKTFVDSLLSWKDPRLPVFAQLNKDTIKANITYEGMPNGLNDGGGPALFYISRYGAYWRETPNAPLELLTYSEVLFLEAEAAQRGWIGGSADSLYTAAIRASMQQYGVSDSAANAYLSDTVRVRYNPANGLTQIAYQKWVSLFMQGMEGWTEVRRTGVPRLVPGPNAILSTIPERLPYASNEQVLNKANVDAAVAAQQFASFADLATPLWFTGRAP